MARGEGEGLKTTVLYSSLGLGVATGALLLANHFIKNAKKKRSENSSTDEDNPAAFAKQLHMAFQNDNYFGWGTNINLIQQVFNALPSKSFYAKVQKAYSSMYSKNLNAELESDLSSDEYNSIIRILGGKKPA